MAMLLRRLHACSGGGQLAACSGRAASADIRFLAARGASTSAATTVGTYSPIPRRASTGAGYNRRSSLLGGVAASDGGLSLTSLASLPSARYLHTSVAHESATLAAAGVSIAVAAVAARYALRALDKANAPPSEGGSVGPAGEGEAAEQSSGGSSSSGDGGGARVTATEKPASGGPASTTPPPPPQSSSTGFFGAQAMARRFYRGGFEDKMTRREAALILGVRFVCVCNSAGRRASCSLQSGHEINDPTCRPPHALTLF